QTPDGGEPLRPRDGAVRLDARRDLFADGDDVRDLFAVNLHRDFADEPVARRAVGRLRLLLDVLDLARGERALELATERPARLPSENLEDVSPQNVAARDALAAQLAVAVPGDDAVVAVNRVERDRKAVNDRLGEAALRLGLGGAPLDLARQMDGRRARGLVERRDARGERGLLRGCVNESFFGLPAVRAPVERDDERAQRATLETKRRGELDCVPVVAQEEL